MNGPLGKLFSLVDSMAVRERVLLWVSLVVCSLALADTFWLGPAQNVQKRLADSVRRESQELETLRSQLRATVQLPRASDPSRGAMEQVAQAKTQLLAVNHEIESASGSRDETSTLPRVLVHFLRRHEGLNLVRTATLAIEAPPARQVAASGPIGTPAVIRRGVELTVSGPYLELMNYVKTLEQSLPTLRWGSMRLSSSPSQPAQLTLQVFVVEVQP